MKYMTIPAVLIEAVKIGIYICILFDVLIPFYPFLMIDVEVYIRFFWDILKLCKFLLKAYFF